MTHYTLGSLVIQARPEEVERFCEPLSVDTLPTTHPMEPDVVLNAQGRVRTCARDRRLRLLREFLALIRPELLDMSMWVRGDVEERCRAHCGTVACAAGWASHVFEEIQVVRVHPRAHSDLMFQGVLSNYRAIADFLGISYKDFEYLFQEDGYDPCFLYGEYDEDFDLGEVTLERVLENFDEVLG